MFFFDEAHLLFDEAPKALVEKVEQVVKLVRSKGVGVYFVTQNPLDMPDSVLAQLGNRVQHALRAYTPREQKAVKAAAETFRPNPELDVEEAITQLGIGEALVSMLGDGGVPTMVERTLVRPPSSRLGPILETERAALINASPSRGKYDTPARPGIGIRAAARARRSGDPDRGGGPLAADSRSATRSHEGPRRQRSQSRQPDFPDLGGIFRGSLDAASR